METESQGGRKKREWPCRIEDHCNHPKVFEGERTITRESLTYGKSRSAEEG